MKKAISYLCIALFLWVVIQPNLSSGMSPEEARVPENTDIASTMTDKTAKKSESKAKVVIDAGRGGSDVGYDPVGHISEKDISLQVAAKIGKRLEDAGYEVEYTRWYDDLPDYASENESDQARLDKAKSLNADYMLSIRFTNADPLQKGYTLFSRPDTEQTLALANAIDKEVKATSYSSSMGVDTDHYGNFTLLGDPAVLTVLFQMGFLSNDEDYTKITNEQIQTKLADAITNAFLESVN